MNTKGQQAESRNRGAYVMPGGIDAHVHLCQDLETGKCKILALENNTNYILV